MVSSYIALDKAFPEDLPGKQAFPTTNIGVSKGSFETPRK